MKRGIKDPDSIDFLRELKNMRIYVFVILIFSTLVSGCETTTRLSTSDLEELQNNSRDGLLLISLGRLERPLPYLPVVYYELLSPDSQTGKFKVVANFKSEVTDLRYFNGNHFSGNGKQAVVHLTKIPAGIYLLSGYERDELRYFPIPPSGGILIPTASSNKVNIRYRVEILPMKLTYAGELITNQDNLSSNASVTVSDEFDRDFEFVLKQHPNLKNIQAVKKLVTPEKKL